jgi:hypothetical protein
MIALGGEHAMPEWSYAYMAFVSAKPISRYPWFIRLVFWKQRLTYGRVLDPSLL